MSNRLELQEILETILGSRNVYFQPPPSVQMKYPAIVYELDNIDIRYANNAAYMLKNRYKVTYITRDPESSLVEELAEIPTCKFTNRYVSDNLYHNVYTLYY